MVDIKVNSISLLDNEDSKIKALATITVNDEIAEHTTLSFKGTDNEAAKNAEKDLKAAFKAQKSENKHSTRR